MFQPVKTALGQYLGRYFASLVPTTKPMQSYVTRALAKAIVWAPGRMVDSAEELLSLWMRADLSGAATKPPELPVILVAMAKDYIPSARDYARQIADRQMVMIPGDPKERLFGLRTIAGDIRAQLVIVAADEPTARSLAAQFLVFIDATENRRFVARYGFAGLAMDWPVQLETPDNPASSIQTEAKNVCVLAVDVNLHVQIPLLDAPAPGAPNDGKGTPGTDDPAGYPLVQQIHIQAAEDREAK